MFSFEEQTIVAVASLDPRIYTAKDEYDFRVTLFQIKEWPEIQHPCGDDYF